MIAAESLTVIGQFIKPHGINGELSAVIDNEINPDDLRCIVMDIDGIFTPFFIESWRGRGSESVLLSIDGICDENHAKQLSGKKIYALTDELPETESEVEDGFYASDFIGWKIIADGTPLGTITEIEDSTANALFIVEKLDGSTIYIPIADEFITSIDCDNKSIEMELPEGMLEI